MLQEEKSDQAAAIYSKCTPPVSNLHRVLLVCLLSGCWKQEEKEEERFFGGGC